MKRAIVISMFSVVVVIALLAPLPTGASVVEAWTQRFNGAGSYDKVAGVAIDQNGNVAITGSSYNGGPPNGVDQYTARYASTNGALIWEKRYNGPGNGSDWARAIAVDKDGNVVVAGSSSGGEETYFDYYVAKYAAADGVLLWERRFNGPASYADEPQAVVCDQLGNVIVTGYSNSGERSDLNPDFYTAKYAVSDGALIWERRYDGPNHGDDRAVALAVDSRGDVVVGGNSVVIGKGSDYCTIKYSGVDGTTLWEKRYQGSGASMDYLKNLAIDDKDHVVVTGYSSSTDLTNFYTAKYASSDASLLWEARYDVGESRSLAIDKNGDVFVVGFAGTANFPWAFGQTESYVIKYSSSDGSEIWSKRDYGRTAKAEAVAVDADGNVIVAGNFNGAGFYAVKYASTNGSNFLTNGTTLWERTYRNYIVNVDGPQCLALGQNGILAIAGTAEVNLTDMFTVLYARPPLDQPRISIEMIPRIRFGATAGCWYEIQRAPAPTGPWGAIGLIIAPADGQTDYADETVTNGAYFYRVNAL